MKIKKKKFIKILKQNIIIKFNVMVLIKNIFYLIYNC